MHAALESKVLVVSAQGQSVTAFFFGFILDKRFIDTGHSFTSEPAQKH